MSEEGEKPAGPAAVAYRDVHCAFAGQSALAGAALTVAPGELYGLVGADGAGKTTLLRLAMGQLQPDAGAVTVLDRPPTDPALRARLAYMPQRFALYDDLSVAENLAFYGDLHGLAPATQAERTASLLERTGLTGFEGRRAGQLSGGMRQKLALAVALLSDPEVLFLDEPTTGVDPVSRRAFWQTLEEIRGGGVTILCATANMEEAERCDRVTFLDAGRSRATGTPEELAARAAGTLVRLTGRDARIWRRRLRKMEGVATAFPVGAGLHVWLREGTSVDALERALQAEGADLSAAALEPTLHDAMLALLTAEDTA